jgi:2,3-bisphosphoglycerate-dependent phosphoglycerate mutase
MTTLVLVRHAQSAPKRELPERDWPLSELGRRQAAELAPALAELGVDALASSPFIRAVDTLRPYAEAAGLPIAVDEDLRETWLGAGWITDPAEVEAAAQRMLIDPDYCLEGGEPGRACLSRFEPALMRLVEANPGRTIAVGSHGGVLRQLLGYRHGLSGDFWRRIHNPHIFVFDAGAELRWTDERTFDGSPGVRQP